MPRIALLFVICLFAAPVLAQDTDPTRGPEQGYIISWDNEVIFPQAIRFSVVIGSTAADLATATLTIQSEGQPAIAISVDIEETAIITDPYTELAYIWEIPRTEPPRLFQQITLEWSILSERNEIAHIQDSFIFTDQRAEWLQDEDPQHVINLTVPTDGPNPARIRRDLMPVYDLLRANVGRAPSFNLILYDGFPIGCTANFDGDFVAVGPVSGVEVECDPTMAETIFSASGYEALQVSSDIISSTVAHLTAGFYETTWLNEDVPVWFRAGLGQFYSPLPKTSLLPTTLVAARNNRLFTLDGMATMSADEIEVWRAQSYGMVLYIANQIGVDGLFALASDLSAEDSFAVAYQTRTGRPLESLIVDWQRWIFTDAAVSAYAYTPYLASTPTPTPSPSRTPFPPTETLTPTFTPTETPTPTVTGVLSDTPAPTRTLTRTPTDAPATITPRPAGSLNTPTPTAATLQVSSDVNRVGLAALILLGLAIIGLVYLRFSRRM